MTQPSHAPQLILASKSPRRYRLLKQAGLSFSVVVSRFDESRIPPAAPDRLVIALAEGKAADVAEQYPEAWVIGADTIVTIDGRILGKPASRSEAGKMLALLSGTTHQVYTGYNIRCLSRGRSISDFVRTDVRFKPLGAEEIEWYIHTDEPFDKAGAYAIQGLGTSLVRSVNGSYTNVVGLPVCEVIECLIREGVITRTR